MLEIDNDVPIPISKREQHLMLAREIYDKGGVKKSVAAKQAISVLKGWGVSEQSEIDFIRRNLK